MSRNRSRWSGNILWWALLALIVFAVVMRWIPLLK